MTAWSEILVNLIFNKFRKSRLHYLRLSIALDHQSLLSEAKKLDPYFVPHRSDQSQGWYSVTLHGLSMELTEDASQYGYKGDFHETTSMTWTEAGLQAPQIRKFVEQFGMTRLGRVRIMRLDPGGYIHPHSDSRNSTLGVAINVALNNPVGCKWKFSDGLEIPFQPGEAYDIDISREHFVSNESNEPRYHVIIHPYFYGRYEKLFIKSFIQQKVQKLLKLLH